MQPFGFDYDICTLLYIHGLEPGGGTRGKPGGNKSGGTRETRQIRGTWGTRWVVSIIGSWYAKSFEFPLKKIFLFLSFGSLPLKYLFFSRCEDYVLPDIGITDHQEQPETKLKGSHVFFNIHVFLY